MPQAVGIDLGTTHSAIAVIAGTGRPRVIENAEGELTTPSVVLFNSPTDVVVGRVARESAVIEAERVVALAKRQIGDPDFRYLIDDHEYTPEYVSACILRKLVKDASDRLGEPITQAVITVPAYFGDNERRATAEAARIAGLEVLSLVDEPTAAALSYGLDRLDREETILVYDLGGGTFDVTILRIAQGTFEVVATDGNRYLGGEDFDTAVMEYVTDRVRREHDIDLQADLASTQDLRTRVEERKKMLCSKDSVDFNFRLEGKTIKVPLSLETFNAIIADRLEVTEGVLAQVLASATCNWGPTVGGAPAALWRERQRATAVGRWREAPGAYPRSTLTWGQIDRVLLVGGSTRMRAVPELIRRVTGKDPVREVHPDHAVALGAAIRAASLVMSSAQRAVFGLPAPEDIVERIAHPLGIAVLNARHERVIDPILEAHSRKGEEVCRAPYSTIADDQTTVELKVYEGAGKTPEECRLLGSAVLDTSPPRPRGVPRISVLFKYDRNGIIEASAEDLDTGKRTAVEIRPTVGGEMQVQRDQERLLASTIT